LHRVGGMRTTALWMLLATTVAVAARAETIPAIGLDEIQPGMKGYGESVFSGERIERFDVEVLGVLRDISPGTSYLLARLSGHDLETSGVIAGMSGSPVWIDGKLAGAVAFSWPFAHEAVAGITPIAAMRAIETSVPWGKAPGSPLVSWSDIVGRKLPEDLLARAAERLVAPAGLGARPAVEWGFRGLDEGGLERLGKSFPALALAASGTSEASAPSLQPGSSVSAVFIDGDFRLAATGTVTDRDGDAILAFGHPIAELGEISLPMASADVVTVLSSSLTSFKLANTGPIVGAFERDHASGTYGRLGVVPHTVPLEVTVSMPTERSYSMRLARVPDLLPVLAAVGSESALEAATATGGVQALDVDLEADLGRSGSLHLKQSFDGLGSASKATQFLLSIVDFLEHNDLGAADLEGLRVRFVPYDAPRAADLVAVHAPASEVHPGDRVELTADLRSYRGGVDRRTLAITIPPDLSAGRYSVLVGDGASLDAVRFALEPPDPLTLDQALDLLRSLGSARQLGWVGVAPGDGVAAEGGALPRLPPSVRSIWSAGAPLAKNLKMAIVDRGRAEEPRPLSGLERVDFEVVQTEVRRPTAAEAGKPSSGASRRGSRRGLR